jgi:hypothetical protein
VHYFIPCLADTHSILIRKALIPVLCTRQSPQQPHHHAQYEAEVYSSIQNLWNPVKRRLHHLQVRLLDLLQPFSSQLLLRAKRHIGSDESNAERRNLFVRDAHLPDGNAMAMPLPRAPILASKAPFTNPFQQPLPRILWNNGSSTFLPPSRRQCYVETSLRSCGKEKFFRQQLLSRQYGMQSLLSELYMKTSAPDYKYTTVTTSLLYKRLL